MSLTVLGALSNPVVLTAAAVGTLDGFGRLVLNIPDFLTSSTDMRNNILRLFVKYDIDGDGRLSREELSKCLQQEFPRGLVQVDDQSASTNSLMEEMDRDGDNFIDYKEFLSSLSTSTGWTMAKPEELLRKARDDNLSYAYEQCKQLTSDYAKTFYLATLAMPAIQARATWAIYAWCRRVDEIVDGPSASPDAGAQQLALDGWMARLDQMWNGASTEGLDDFDVAFMDMLKLFPGSDIEPYRDMVRGMQMDIPDRVVYRTWDDLYLYCYRVAST
eukprot:CAMPEP_0172166254 /NCGR_PEP_ID=MMETSP1050-20130122/8874_1 /TAXON_ID=233186 /ORGANISM="Cryptomonas curvata, Strain CCAP979/52" /LENGTH=273 /DNA_ID=CAMNT_0012836833 /DNA_START=219 /DNA_END=1037 /DNA_ORIENTATION=+